MLEMFTDLQEPMEMRKYILQKQFSKILDSLVAALEEGYDPEQMTQEQREWQDIEAQGQALKKLYPSFDLDAEMANAEFGKSLAFFKSSGIYSDPVRRAYELVHRDEIMGGAMQYAVQQTQQKISNSIQSGMARPQENGTSQTAAGAPTALDPSKLTKAQIEDIKRRAAAGERITF